MLIGSETPTPTEPRLAMRFPTNDLDNDQCSCTHCRVQRISPELYRAYQESGLPDEDWDAIVSAMEANGGVMNQTEPEPEKQHSDAIVEVSICIASDLIRAVARHGDKFPDLNAKEITESYAKLYAENFASLCSVRENAKMAMAIGLTLHNEAMRHLSDNFGKETKNEAFSTVAEAEAALRGESARRSRR